MEIRSDRDVRSIKKLLLRPGTSDDDNRDYLPERIKGSGIVVNENGNYSQPYLENLLECTEALTADGIQDTWYEYIPSCYDPAKRFRWSFPSTVV